jgi:hypothetical protein
MFFDLFLLGCIPLQHRTKKVPRYAYSDHRAVIDSDTALNIGKRIFGWIYRDKNYPYNGRKLRVTSCGDSLWHVYLDYTGSGYWRMNMDQLVLRKKDGYILELGVINGVSSRALSQYGCIVIDF